MIRWFAAGSGGGSSPLWSLFIVPGGAVAAALIAGVVSWWINRKPPHEKLEKLIGIFNDWPEELEGKETVSQSVALTLAQIRRADKMGVESVPTAAEKKADRRAFEIERLQPATWLVPAALGSMVTVIVNGTYIGHWAQTSTEAVEFISILIAVGVSWYGIKTYMIERPTVSR